MLKYFSIRNHSFANRHLSRIPQAMNKGKTIFAQIMSLVNAYEFKKCVNRYKGYRHAIKFNCRDQFMVMSFAQFTDRSGLRDIV